MKMTYDLKYNVGYISFKEKTEVVNSIKMSEDLVVDIAPDGSVYGIELLNVKEQMFGDKLQQILLLNENTGAQKAVELL